jgi:hypothetical protein
LNLGHLVLAPFLFYNINTQILQGPFLCITEFCFVTFCLKEDFGDISDLSFKNMKYFIFVR